MCGIAGVWSPSVPGFELEAAVSRSLDLLAHRGPDDCGIWSDQQQGPILGHRRLAIVDLSPGGHQPMLGAGGRTTITFNGEIYNYIEARQEMTNRGAQFHTSSDTEVILALYERYGDEFLPHLRGMFALALWDAGTRRLILARDRLGKKPLYYYRSRDCLAFASEIKGVLPFLPSAPTLDESAIDDYLSFGFVSGERTIYREIRELPPAGVLIATGPSKISVSRYWQPEWHPKSQVDFRTAVQEADDRLTEAVTVRLRADVPIGIFLSGGIDSALITAIASRHAGSRCRTYSVGFEDSAFDERAAARRIAKHCGTIHHEELLLPNAASLLPTLAWHYDEPFADASALASFAIARYAREHVRVILNGDGGDELFGGYRRHLAALFAARLRALIPGSDLSGVAGLLLACLPSPKARRNRYRFCHRFLQGLVRNRHDSLVAWYTDGFAAQERQLLYIDSSRYLRATPGVPMEIDSLGEVDRALAIDLIWELPGDLLVKMDIATMAFGIEARSPFLDQELAGWANRLPENIRLGTAQTKPLLRALAQKYLPDWVSRVPKRGFEVPIARWLRNELRVMRDDLILSRSGILATLFRRSQLERVLRSAETSDRLSQRVWILLMLALWDCHGHRWETTPSLAVYRTSTSD